MDERQAIARLKQGDPCGLEALVRRYQVQAVHAAYLIVQDRALAEDIVQTAFIRTAEKIDQFDLRRPFGPWFLRSVVNASLKAAYRQKRFISLEAESEKETFSPSEWLADPLPGPEAQAETNESRREVRQALERLLPEHRAAVVLRYFLNMSESEMVPALERPLSTVKWWLHAARERLRSLLHAHHANADPETSPPGRPRQSAAEGREQE